MSVIKLSKSKKSVQFIDDNGNVFFTSVNYLLGLLNGKSPSGFILLKRLPIPISSGRFAKSPLWDPDGVVNSKTLSVDAFSEKYAKDTEKKNSVKDRVVW